MVIESVLESIVSPLLAGGCWGNVAPDKVPTPYAVYSNVVSPTETNLDGLIPIQQSIIQLTVWHLSYSELKASVFPPVLADIVDYSANADAVACVVRSNQDRYDPAKKLHGIMLELSFWYP